MFKKVVVLVLLVCQFLFLGLSSSSYSVYALENTEAQETVIKDAKDLTVDSIKNQSYTGSEITPTVVVKDGDVVLDSYTVKYENNVNPGKATITITVDGYTGNKTISFNIVPAKVSLKSVTTSSQKLVVKWNKVAKASGYRIAYQKQGAKWSYTNVSASTYSKTLSKLTNNKYYNVKVAAYVTIDGENVYGTYSSTKKIKVQQTKQEKIVSVAKSKLGTPYKWGATGPNAFDCSGFTRYVYKQATGKTLPHNSSAQKTSGKVVSLSKVQVGDVVWRSGHVGIYVGNGKVIHSPHTGAVVSYTSVKGFKYAVRY